MSLTAFARKLKAAVPNIELWVALADAGKVPPTYVLPAEVDCLMIDCTGLYDA